MQMVTDTPADDGAAAAGGRHTEDASPEVRDGAEDSATVDGNSDAGQRIADEDDDRRPQEAFAVDQGEASDLVAADVDVLAKGVASVLGPVMHNFDAGMKGVLHSQNVLSSSIDRLTRELDKLLEDVPHPYTTHHATRLSGICKRVIAMNTSLRKIQKRIETIQRLLAGHASRTARSSKQRSSVKGSNSACSDVSDMGTLVSELSAHSVYNDNDNELPKFDNSEVPNLSKKLSSEQLGDGTIGEREET